MAQLQNSEGEAISAQPAGDDIRALVEKNLELTEEVLSLTKKLDRFRKWQQVYSIIKVLLIVVPLVLGIIYLPALLDKALEPYGDLLDLTGQTNNALEQLGPDILKSLRLN